MQKIILICLAVALARATPFTLAEGFYQLDATNYEAFVKEHPGAVVLYVAKNCKNSENLQKVLSEVAESHPDMKLARIVKEDNLDFVNKQQSVYVFPHLRLHVTHQFYSVFGDAIDESHVKHFLTQHLNVQAKVKNLDEKDNYEQFKKADIAIYLSFKTLDENQRTYAQSLQDVYPEIQVYVGQVDSKMDEELFPNAKSIFRALLKRSFDDGNKSLAASSQIPPERLLNMINVYKHPKVMIINAKNSEKLFKHRPPVIILFDHDYDSPSMRAFTAAAQTFNFQGMLLKSNLSEVNSRNIAELLGVTEKDFPTLRLIQFGVTRSHRYRFEGELTEENIHRYFEQYRLKKISEYFRSEEPQDNKGQTVAKIVASNLTAISENKDADTIVLFTNERSPHDRPTISAFHGAAERLRNEKSVVFGKINLDKNDVSHINLSHLPVIQVFKKGKAVSQPVKYTAPQTADGVIAFAEEQLGRKLETVVDTDEL
jgi:thioredoxin-like negative regulator of GroEL